MVGFDTEATDCTDPPRDDALHQEYLADYLSRLGAKVELFEPDEDEFCRHPMALPGQSFKGRPILWAEFEGAERPSVLFNGHYDTVSAAPVDAWTSSPRAAEVRDGRLFGRGSCDMKGGIAAAIAAVATLVQEDRELGGPICFNVVPFEEHNGMGTIATMLRGFRADAAVCCEPTDMQPLVACHGLLGLNLRVTGRAAHAEIGQPHHSHGGGVNAIDKLGLLVDEVRRLNSIWAEDPARKHPFLAPPAAVLSMISGGTYWASIPGSAEATYDITYLPGDADERGYGSRVRAEIEARLAAACRLDDWLAGNPAELEWFVDFPSAEISEEEPIVAGALAATRRLPGRESVEVGGFDSWADQMMLIKEGGIPTVLWGPGSIMQAHTIDEYIELEEVSRGVAGYLGLLRNWWS
jgi:acetylornithine deacetylase